MFILFLIVTSTYAEDYYSYKEENLPVLGQEYAVYLGDRMITQRYGYFEKCLTPKKSLELQSIMFKKSCLLSTRRFERKDRYGGKDQIEEGGVMCPYSLNFESNSPTKPLNLEVVLEVETYYPDNFKGFVRLEEGAIAPSVESFSFREKKGNISIYQGNPRLELERLSRDEFKKSFIEIEKLDEIFLFFKKDSKICMPLGSKSENIYLVGEEDNFTHRAYYSNSSESDNLVPAPILNIPSLVIKKSESGRYHIYPTILYPGLKTLLKYINPYKSRRSEFDERLIRFAYFYQSEEDFDNSFDESKRYVIHPDRMQQTIEYAGKNGDILKFLYTEYSGGLARDAFTREFQLDLKEGNVGGFKGAIFEVLEATNMNIKYKVIRHFPVN